MRSFEACFRTALAFMANPHALWVLPRYEDKRPLLRLAFARPLTYGREEGFRLFS